MHRTETFPQDDLRLPDLLGGQTALWLVEIPYHHLVQIKPHGITGITPQMLVGEKQDFFALFETPVEHMPGIGRSTDDATMFTAETFQVGG